MTIEREADWKTPLDEQWLCHHGFELDDECGAWCLWDDEGFPLFVKRAESDPSVWTAEIDGTEWPIDIRMRGQIRDLCRALERPLSVEEPA